MRRMGWCSLAQGLRSVKPIQPYTEPRCAGFGGCIGLLALLFSSPAFAAPDIHAILNNIRGIIVPLTALVLVLSFIAGVIMIYKALLKMKRLGGSMSQQSQPGELGGALTYLFVGTVLVYLPTSTDMMMRSLFETSASIFGSGGINYNQMGQGSTILGYASNASLEQQWGDMANTLVLYIQFLGFLSFVKGWFILSKGSAAGQQPGTMTKGFTHVIGGICLVNIVNVIGIIRNTILGS
jgi:intracellular multiplication protein IcmC